MGVQVARVESIVEDRGRLSSRGQCTYLIKSYFSICDCLL